MLVLSRKVGEKILIGDNISVTVVRVAQGMVRIGVEAPQNLPVVREEIKDQMRERHDKSQKRQQRSKLHATAVQFVSKGALHTPLIILRPRKSSSAGLGENPAIHVRRRTCSSFLTFCSGVGSPERIGGWGMAPNNPHSAVGHNIKNYNRSHFDWPCPAEPLCRLQSQTPE